MSNNCYVLRCRATDEQLLVDAAADAPRLLAVVGDGGLATVVTTHQHWDHHRALADVVSATGASPSPAPTTPGRSPSRPGSRSAHRR